MNKFPLVLSLIAVAGVSSADLKSDIKAARAKLEKAVMAKDVKGAEAAMKEFLAPDFKYVQDGKTQDAKTFIGNYTMSLVMMDKITSSTTRTVSLTQNGNKATGKIEHIMTGTMKTSNKKTHPIDWTGMFIEDYRKVGGKWKLATMTAGPQKFLMDGKPVKM